LSKNFQINAAQKRTYLEKEKVKIEIPSLSVQASLLGISRSGVYYTPRAVPQENISAMHRIDEIYTKHPFYGVRKITHQLREEGMVINHKRTHRLMQEMGIQALYPKPNLSRNDKEHTVYPYLLKGLNIERPNQVWGTDITYIRMKTGFVYLTAFMDWYSRYVLSWRLSTTLETRFCIEAAQEAIERYGHPEITNQDQGVQYTSDDYHNVWNLEKTKLSMDHRGRCFDNIFTERLWRTIKYEEVYLKSYETVQDAQKQLSEYITFYNTERFHQSLGNLTPKQKFESIIN